jgi:hypothetical protein
MQKMSFGKAGCRGQGAGGRVQGAGCRGQGAGCRGQGAGGRVQGAGGRGQGAGYTYNITGIFFSGLFVSFVVKKQKNEKKATKIKI